MRNRETEWSLPMLRFFGALFIPPICATLLLTLQTTLSADFPPAVFASFFGSLMFSTVPSVFWFVSMEKLYESKETIRSSRLRFTLAGALLGAVFTITLFLGILAISGGWRDFVFILNPIYLVIGLFSGYTTAHVIFPKKKEISESEIPTNSSRHSEPHPA